MFNYTNTLIVNSAKDSSGLDKFKGIAPSAEGEGDGAFKALRVNTFLHKNIVSVTKRAYSDPVLAKATYDFTTLGAAADKAGRYQLNLYITLEGNNNAYYSNALVFKGAPHSMEFTVKSTDTAADIASSIKDSIMKYQSLFGMQWLKVTSAAAVLTIEAKDEYQRFAKAEINKFDVNVLPMNGGSFVEYAKMTINPRGKEGFGTWIWMIKNLHMPTIENERFMAPNQEERPIAGGKYSEYVLRYRVTPTQSSALGCVGEVSTSETYHVFFVESGVIATFEAALTTAGITPTVI